MMIKLILAASFLLVSCASHSPTPEVQATPRTISSDKKSPAEDVRKPDQIMQTQPPPAESGDPAEEEASTVKPTGKIKPLNIPADQTEIADRCEKQLADVPDAYKSSIANFPIHHRALTISYNAKYRIPNWVSYHLTRENLMNSCAKRNDKFRGDSVLASAGFSKDLIINETSFKGSGFDRGHMAPSGDFIWDQDLNSETFFMTNMSPQTAELNQKTWNKLEAHVRNWACGLGDLKVYTGPIIEPNMKRLNSCVSIPNKFFKVLLGKKDKKLIGIGFVYDQADRIGDPYKQNAVSIRKVEELSGLNFFGDDYAQKVQDDFETQFDIKNWDGSEENCYACDGVPKKGG